MIRILIMMTNQETDMSIENHWIITDVVDAARLFNRATLQLFLAVLVAVIIIGTIFRKLAPNPINALDVEW